MLDKTLAASRALVIDPNTTSRSILCAQLRDLGVGHVVQTSRVRDARGLLETRPYDIVLCEMDFRDSDQTGQQLLDELRRDGLMPLSTVFVMVTGEASYARVAEAAEAGLDSFLIKPFTATMLRERLQRSRNVKAAMLDTLAAVEAGQFEAAAKLCLQRVQERAPHWLYAARIGAELLLRLGQHDVARKLLEAVAQTHPVPWTQLGIARAQLAAMQVAPAMATLKNLLVAEPGFVDAYDVMGRIHTQQGDLTAALVAHRKAADLTPGSIGRQQKLGILAFYLGDNVMAGQALDRALVTGLNSKSFDPLVLLLLSVVRYHQGDQKGLRRCITDLNQALERQRGSVRLQRFVRVARMFDVLLSRQIAQAVEMVRELAQDIRQADFDAEAACNMLAVLARLVNVEVRLPEAETWVETIGVRFCTTKGVAELLARTAGVHAGYGTLVRDVNTRVTQWMEDAMTHSLRGDPESATKALLDHAHKTLNPRFSEAARRLLQRHGERITDLAGYTARLDSAAALTAPVSTPPLGRDNLDGSLRLRADARADAVPEAATAA